MFGLYMFRDIPGRRRHRRRLRRTARRRRAGGGTGHASHPHARPRVPQARRPVRRPGVDPRVDRLVLVRPLQAGLCPVLLGIHRRDRRVHPYPRVRRVDSRTTHQSGAPRFGAGFRPHIHIRYTPVEICGRMKTKLFPIHFFAV